MYNLRYLVLTRLGCGSSCLGVASAFSLLPWQLPQIQDKCLNYIIAFLSFIA